MRIHIREQPLPGIGARYEVTMDGEERLVVVARRDGRREVGRFTGAGDDQPETLLSLTGDQAVALAAILMGARFSLDADAGGHTGDETVVETVELPVDSWIVGKAIKEARLPDDPRATVLAVIRDETPELIEDDETEIGPGDRVVIAARRDRVDEVVRELTHPHA